MPRRDTDRGGGAAPAAPALARGHYTGFPIHRDRDLGRTLESSGPGRQAGRAAHEDPVPGDGRRGSRLEDAG